MKTYILDATTGEAIERDMTPEEIADAKKVTDATAALMKPIEEAAKAQAELRKSALEKLAAVGLTPEEIAAL